MGTPRGRIRAPISLVAAMNTGPDRPRVWRLAARYIERYPLRDDEESFLRACLVGGDLEGKG